MPQTGTEILSIKGDPIAGLGANAEIPAINPQANLNAVIDAGRTAMLLNHENNVRLYQQKIQDRNQLYSLLGEGKVQGGNVLETDRPYLQRLKEDANKAFFDAMAKGGLNNPQAVTAYRDKIKDLNDAAIQANARYIGVKQLETEKANSLLSKDQQAYQKHIDAQLGKGFWGMVDPYQKSLDFDHDKMNGFILNNGLVTAGEIGTSTTAPQSGTTQWQSVTTKVDKNGNLIPTTKTTTKISPLKTTVTKQTPKGTSGISVGANGTLSEFSETPEKHYDYGNILANATDAFLHDEEQLTYQNMWKQYFESGDPYSAKKVIDHTNEKLNQYNQERGLKPGDEDKGYAAPLVIGQDVVIDPQTGKIKINVPTPEFAAKTALASIEGGYVQKPQAIFNKDIAAYKVAKEKADSDAFYKRAMAGAAQTKARAYVDNLHQQMKLRKDAAEQDNFLDEIWNRNLSQQPSLFKYRSEAKTGGLFNAPSRFSFSEIEANNSLPVFTLVGKTPVQLKPIGAEDIKDKSGKLLGYKGGYYEQQYFIGDKQVTPLQMQENFVKFRKIAGNNWTGTIDDYMKEAIKQDALKVKLKGENGATDKQLSLAAQRIISNAATKKGQTAVFDINETPEPVDVQIPDDNNQ